ncbi:hypothetical protein H2248_010466 [Termitomyces sp. 'cryptogamus']|nr:hypothetical protein H2248_010466 [Termitomyces sp. 'cryptogamus']
MVVNRRISVSTAPPVSRTASTQPAVRVPEISMPSVPNVHSQPDEPKKKRRRKATKPKKKIVTFPRLLQVLFALFVVSVYASVVCRSDFSQSLLLCRSLDLYRRQIVDPYILPPVASVIQHAEPYVSTLKPYAISTAKFTRTHITPHISAFIDSSLFYYHAEVAPRLQWLIVDRVRNGVMKPLYFDALHPTFERHTRPFYNDYLAPGASKVAAYAQATFVRVLPHAQHFLLNARKNAARVYEVVRLHMLDLHQRIRPHVIVFLDQAHTYALALAQKAGDSRRQFIDPHVRKILDKVTEKHDPSSDDSSTDSSAHPLVGSLSDVPPLDI